MVDEGEEGTKKKRGAERQLTKDEFEDGKEVEEKEEIQTTKDFPKASEETLSKRRILKAKRPGDSSSTSANPFSTVLNKEGSKPTFGSYFKSSGFGANATSGTKFSFGATSGGFGKAASTGDGASFGTNSSFSFGKTGKSSIFGAGTSSKEGDSTDTPNFTFAKSSTNESTKQKVTPILPQDVEVSNGEEGDECLMEIRAKSFELVVEEERKGPKSGEKEAASMPGLSSNGNANKSDEEAKKKDEEVEQKEEEKCENNSNSEKGEEGKKEVDKVTATEEPSKETESTKSQREDSASDGNTSNTSTSAPTRWREIGIGPLRVLKSSAGITRIVQRRESAEGGMGTKVIINVLLKEESEIRKEGESYLRLATISSNGAGVFYLLKVKQQNRQALHNLLATEINAAKSAVSQ